MGLTGTGNHEEGVQEERADNATSPDEPATSQLLAGAVGGRCVNCGAPLAADQHYCIQCGERRGKSRFAASSALGPAVEATTRVSQPAPGPGRRRGWSGATVVAGIATLLLAMGVGVEIGRIGQSNNSGKVAAAPQVITVNGGGGGTAQTTTAASKAPTAKHAKAALAPKTEKKKAQAAAARPKPTQQAVKKASNAASSVLGGNGEQSNNTVTTGAQCKAGSPGCQNGHFTGTFFGQ